VVALSATEHASITTTSFGAFDSAPNLRLVTGTNTTLSNFRLKDPQTSDRLLKDSLVFDYDNRNRNRSHYTNKQ